VSIRVTGHLLRPRTAGMLAVLSAALLASCTGAVSRKPAIEIFNDMRHQPKLYPQGESNLGSFTDGRAERRPVPGTIAHGELRPDGDPFYTGQVNGQYVAKNPLPLNAETMHLGQMRFNTYCTPCHGRTGNGKGIVGIRSVTWIASNLVEDRVKNFSDGDIFDVITNGRRSMPSYRYQIVEQDRWAIIAYVRALQRSASATVDDVPGDMRTELH
jgi:mono/diheme cytochrome c family protein